MANISIVNGDWTVERWVRCDLILYAELGMRGDVKQVQDVRSKLFIQAGYQGVHTTYTKEILR